MRNPTPRQIALIASGMVFLGAAIGLFLLILIFSLEFQPSLLILPLLLFGIAYVVFYYFLENFIYRKIKLIYKTIHSFKVGKNQPTRDFDMDQDIIDEVDLTVRAWAEDKSKEIEDLKRSANYRREFLGNVSHELKTPIFNVQGYIDTLLDGGLEDDRINKEYLYKASKSVDRLITIVEDLDAINKLESGRLSVQMERFDITKLVKEVLENNELLLEANDIKASFKEGCDRPFFVEAERESIRQVLTNLITNAVRYGKEEGKISIGIYDMDEHLLIEVADNGIGIAEHHIPRLFERFYRVDTSRSRSQGGTGLGLAIVKHIIEAHHQAINVRSKEGVGSTFGFTLKKAS